MMKNVGKSAVFLGALALTLSVTTVGASAHGYISKPESRAYLAKLGVNQNAGPIQYEPQSVEATGNFPASGPADGHIAGGGKFNDMDVQTAIRWHKVDVSGGANTIEWTLTANHRTSEWKYFITKKDWNPNEPITRASLEHLTTIDGNNAVPPSKVTQTVNLPTDRSGYYVLLGVWEIADTGNAFYQVVDLNLSNNGTSGVSPLQFVPTSIQF
ncbi:lytic polysaccharide monooxygenase [Listeria fleischmannii]|uniref:Chitin-binding protein n=1 Tax=Listeria fleischmannii TaxID=1069827 RepID=A0A841YF01_9LIST|nr:lytic polysaccharide monooxygenase [Listeria fleischmannii]EIA21571.1 chitin-binding protein/carbohydrate-binding protein [Listeria fleischmannii subsp. coloradonensis]MBC1398754.1 chitin-binding protein [Listeria fleischmannii]MBC1426903.1 chitin-binding protein [Listeria fleischmannii]STY35896.1 GlcNAc-binding protein A precursor [Listeria fleischmannii subsp. coloradonensis]